MKFKALIVASLLCGVVFPHAAFATPASDALGSCLVDSLSGKERKELALSIFFAMAMHPEIKPYANISDADRLTSDQDIGKLLTRLLARDCAQQTHDVAVADGPNGLSNAFELVGKVAMRELMTNKDVMNSMGSYMKYVDEAEISKVMH